MKNPEFDPLTQLQALLRRTEQTEGSLVDAVLVLSLLRDPNADVGACLRQIDDWADYLQRLIADDADAAERVRVLNAFLFDELGFTGSNDGQDDPNDNFLDKVIEHRRGARVTLSVLYIELAHRIGLQLHGADFPGGFVVVLPVTSGAVVLDPFAEGVSLATDDLELRLFQADLDRAWHVDQIPQMLAKSDVRRTLVLILNELKALYREVNDLVNALWVQDALLALDAGRAEDRRDRGVLNEMLGRHDAAAEDFATYLQQVPNANDAETIRERLVELRRRKIYLH